MNRLTAAQIDRGRRLLECESVQVRPGESVTDVGAVRVYDKLLGQLVPLIGTSGAELLFVRSAKVTGGEFRVLADVSIFDGAAKLRSHLGGPSVAPDAAAELFGTVLVLISTFIGERLTSQVLRRAWPHLQDAAEKEQK